MQLSENEEAVNPLILAAAQELRLDWRWVGDWDRREINRGISKTSKSLYREYSSVGVHFRGTAMATGQETQSQVKETGESFRKRVQWGWPPSIKSSANHLRTGMQHSLCPCGGLVGVTLKAADPAK